MQSSFVNDRQKAVVTEKGVIMIHILVRHKVNDYASWKVAFDNHAGFRRSGGEKSHRIFHSGSDPNDLTMLMEWDNLPNAEKFFSSPELKSAMQKAGVAEMLSIQFLNEAV